MKDTIKILLKGIPESYSQIFFSNNKLFAVILILASFIDVWAGLAGLIAVVIVNVLGLLLGFDKLKISKGLYGFNALLVGLGLGIYFDPSTEFYIVLFFASLLTFLLNIALEGIIGKYGLPFLSIPFLFAIWIITLATRDFEALGISTRGIYALNDMYILGGESLVNVYNWWNSIEFLESLRVYFISLGAIFFQYNVLAGILISIGLLYYSRIAFSLSLIGFYAAFLFYDFIGAELTDLNYTYIGFNYILTSIAIGGFFLIPSYKSYLWTILLVPVIALITISTNIVFSYYQLSIYSLPFNIVVLLFIYALKFRLDVKKGPTETGIQHNSPEKNLYAWLNHKQRFKNYKNFPIALPFWGEWTVSQGHDGEHTHKDKWKHAWDFIIKDTDNKSYKNSGDLVEDYFCYNKAIIAPANGIIEEINDGIEDNTIGEVNLHQNWGNTIIIKHLDGLYTKLSHLKPDSIKVKKGDYVKKGDSIANVGNSGRSPEPHLHFQVQATPYIGSETLNYPLGYYINHNEEKKKFIEFSKPKEEDIVSNVESNQLLIKAFKLIPGQTLEFEINNKKEKWKVLIDIYNNTYLYCENSRSTAYFETNDNMLYFKHFTGDKKTLLFNFFLAAYKVQFGFYKDMTLKDILPSNTVFSKSALFLQDFIAPFIIYLKPKYEINYQSIDDDFSTSKIILKSKVDSYRFNKIVKSKSFEFHIDKKGIDKIIITKKNEQKIAKCIRE